MKTSEIIPGPSLAPVIPPPTYSIGIYEGTSPFELKPAAMAQNPIISRKDFPPNQVNFVADPFLFFHQNLWYLFFEILPMGSRKGIIASATSEDGYTWTQQETVLEENFHLSYPYVFTWEGEVYMIPETYESESVRLYKADNFPRNWVYQKDLLQGSFVDSSVVEYEGKWWMFTCATPREHDSLHLYYAEQPIGPWIEHPSSPILENNPSCARPGGRMLQWNNRLFRFAQDCVPFYGAKVRAFEILELSTTKYQEKEMDQSPLLEGVGEGWNGVSMHHIDVQKMGENHWIAAVDGRRN